MKGEDPRLGVREVVVRPHCARRETLLLGGLVALILGVVGLRVWMLQSPGSERQLRPYQLSDNALTGAPRTLYRTLLSSIAEILMLREEEGLWPEAELLEATAVPPFARRYLPPALRDYLWLGYDGGSWIDYLGQDPGEAGAPSFILRLIDLHAGYHPHPHPGVDYDPERTVAAQVWFHPESARVYPGERLPEAGWLWLLSSSDPLLGRQDRLGPPQALAAEATP